MGDPVKGVLVALAIVAPLYALGLAVWWVVAPW